MKGIYVLSPRVQVDFDEIWDYTAHRWGLDQAESYIRQVWDRIESLAAYPAIGQECADIRPGYYRISCGSQVLFYRLTTEGVDVVRILHERMDFERHFPWLLLAGAHTFRDGGPVGLLGMQTLPRRIDFVSMDHRMTSSARNASRWNPALYFVLGQLGWFACVLSAAKGFPLMGVVFVLVLIASHIIRAPQPLPELKLIGITALIGAVWESVLVAVGLLSYPSGMLVHGLAPYWLIALWALFAAQFNTTYIWLKSKLAVAALLGAITGPVSFHAGAALGALKFEKSWPAAPALALGWACLLPLIAVLSRQWDGIKAHSR